MKSFKEYITENIQPNRVHKNTSVVAMKHIAKNTKGHTLRWIVDEKDKLHAGSSYHHDHASLHYETSGNENNDYKAYGFAAYHPKDKKHYYSQGWGNLSDKHRKQLDKHFIEHDEKSGNDN
jgi:hypothetical protein